MRPEDSGNRDVNRTMMIWEDKQPIIRQLAHACTILPVLDGCACTGGGAGMHRLSAGAL